MQIDRRITNGLAWAGALLVVAIPAADAALRQFSTNDAPQIAVVEEQAAPAPDTEPLPEPEAKPAPQPTRDPVATASTAPSVSESDAVDTFLQSGRKLPSYISDGGEPERTDTAAVAPAALPEPAPVAALPTRTVTFPTPVSERPAPVPRSALVQPPLVIEQPGIVVTAEDLQDWESGPLSEFLARRQAAPAPLPQDYDPDGFFLDEGPNSSTRVTRFPRAYGYDEFAFE